MTFLFYLLFINVLLSTQTYLSLSPLGTTAYIIAVLSRRPPVWQPHNCEQKQNVIKNVYALKKVFHLPKKKHHHDDPTTNLPYDLTPYTRLLPARHAVYAMAVSIKNYDG